MPAADLSQLHRGIASMVGGAERLERELKQLAHRRALTVAEKARERVRVRTGKTKAHIRVVENSAQHAFTVAVEDVEGRNPMVPVWIEFGTSKMAAQPFLGPAIDSSRGEFEREAAALLMSALAEVRP
jgi:HK97 gp10 family phage protein